MISAGLRVANVVLAVQMQARDRLIERGIEAKRIALYSTTTMECGLLVDEEVACTVTTTDADGVYSIGLDWSLRYNPLCSWTPLA